MRADHPSGTLELHAAPARRQSPGAGPQGPAGWTQRAGPSIDWAKWMRELGARIRRVREFVGLSQEQLARLAGVSQGAVSRLEAGRGLATPLLVLMKINVPLLRALRGLDPSILNDELRRMLDETRNISPPVGDMGYEALPLTRDPGVEELIRCYHELPERQRRTFLSVMSATASSLANASPAAKGKA
ncbi:MAG: helix-turn-helix domain-containing protein [Deltaproteobacteria bacterium]|nr:MAG: helix-turn-helix domain-containing protein [Deltaproteobacteria bacterium]